MPLRPHRMHEGRSRAILGAVTVVVLLVQTAPAASGLLASFLHGAFHLTSRTGLEHLETTVVAQEPGRAVELGLPSGTHVHPHPDPHPHPHPHPHARTSQAGANDTAAHEVAPMQPVEEVSAAARNVHTHGPGQAPHTHAPVVDAVLEIAATSNGPAVGPTATLDRSAERYLRPDRPDLAPVRSTTVIQTPAPDAPASPLAADPPVPPPRA